MELGGWLSRQCPPWQVASWNTTWWYQNDFMVHTTYFYKNIKHHKRVMQRYKSKHFDVSNKGQVWKYCATLGLNMRMCEGFTSLYVLRQQAHNEARTNKSLPCTTFNKTQFLKMSTIGGAHNNLIFVMLASSNNEKVCEQTYSPSRKMVLRSWHCATH